MNRIILIAILVLAVHGLRAQQMDTVRWGNPYYYWDAFVRIDSIHISDYDDPIPGSGSGEQGYVSHGDYYVYKRFSLTPGKDSLTITGVALPVRTIVPDPYNSTVGGINRLINNYSNYLDLKFFLPSTATPDTPVDSIRFTSSNVRTIARHNKLFVYDYYELGRNAFWGPQYDTLWEFYFEEPVTVGGEF